MRAYTLFLTGLSSVWLLASNPAQAVDLTWPGGNFVFWFPDNQPLGFPSQPIVLQQDDPNQWTLNQQAYQALTGSALAFDYGSASTNLGYFSTVARYYAAWEPYQPQPAWKPSFYLTGLDLAAFDAAYGPNISSTSVTVAGYRNGALVGSFTAVLSDRQFTYFDVGWGKTIDSFTISSSGLGKRWLLDDISVIYPPVPEPETWALLLGGLAGLSARQWRRGAQTRVSDLPRQEQTA